MCLWQQQETPQMKVDCSWQEADALILPKSPLSDFYLSTVSSPGARGGAFVHILSFLQSAQTPPVPPGSPKPSNPAVSHPVPLLWAQTAEATPAPSSPSPPAARPGTQRGVISQRGTPELLQDGRGEGISCLNRCFSMKTFTNRFSVLNQKRKKNPTSCNSGWLVFLFLCSVKIKFRWKFGTLKMFELLKPSNQNTIAKTSHS